jgi:hypothetical protein
VWREDAGGAGGLSAEILRVVGGCAQNSVCEVREFNRDQCRRIKWRLLTKFKVN